MTVHARYTILDAQGAIAPRAKKAAKPAKAAKSSAAESNPKPAQEREDAEPAKRSWFHRTAVDAAHTSPPAPSAKTLENAKGGGKPSSAKQLARQASAADNAGHDDAAPRMARKQRPATEDDYQDEVDRRLSKAERKAMRRQKDRPQDDE